MRLPRKLRVGSAFSIEWNAMVDYVRSLTAAPSAGTTFVRTPFGTVRGSHGRRAASSSTTEVQICNPDTGTTETWMISGQRLS